MATTASAMLSLERIEVALQKWRGDNASAVWDAGDDDVRAYVGAIEALQSLVEKVSADNAGVGMHVVREGAKAVLNSHLPKLEEGFLQVLLANSTPVPPEKVYEAYKTIAESNAPVRVREAHLPQEQRSVCFMPDSSTWRLHLIARAMLRVGLGVQCCRSYKNIRKPALEDSLRLLSRGQFEGRDVPVLSWDVLSKRVEAWTTFVKVATRMLLASERRICERVLDSAEMSDACFAETSKGCVPKLFEFVEAFAAGKKSPERLFCLLDCYETLSKLQDDFNVVFSGDGACRMLRNELSVVMSCVAKGVRGVFQELEDNIKKEPSKPPVTGAVHGLTSYVVNYLNLLYEYRDTISKLYAQGSAVVPVPKLLQSRGEDDDEEGDEFVEEEEEDDEEDGEDEEQKFWGEPPPDLHEASVRVKRKLQCLEDALHVKAKHYKDPALQSFFLLNNVYYICRKVKETDLRVLVGDDWIRDGAERVQLLAADYMRQTWNKVTCHLKEDPPSTFRLKNTNKDKFRQFTAAFEEVCRVQRTWMVQQGPLHDELLQAVKYRVVSIYQDFYDRHSGPLISGRNAQKYVKFAPAIVNEMINGLFEGSS